MVDNLKNIVTYKEDIINNLGKALDEQSTKFEVQNEQNTILMEEYKNNMNDLNECSSENGQLKEDLQKANMIAVDKEELNNTKDALAEKELKLKELKDQNICKICLDNKMDTAFLPCGHVVTC